MTRWDVTYARGDAAWDGTVAVIQLDGTILRIDPTPSTIPTTDPATRVIQGDDR